MSLSKLQFLPDPNTGQDRWKVFYTLKGGMGEVLVAYDLKWNVVTALKTYQGELLNSLHKDKFIEEVNAWIRMPKHQNVVWAHKLEEIQGRIYVFMEYCPNGDLEQRIQNSNIPIHQWLPWIIQLCHGLLHAYRNGIQAHQDIKPSNCLISVEGQLKLTDFGLSQTLFQNDKGQGGGTLPYMPPEAFSGNGIFGVHYDVYSFGVLLYQLINRELPFQGHSREEFQQLHASAAIPSFKVKGLPKYSEWEKLVSTCLAKSPQDRWSSFEQLLDVLMGLHYEILGKEAPVPEPESSLRASDLLNKGMALSTLGFDPEAILWFEKALVEKPDYGMALSNLAMSYGKIGAAEKALNFAQRAMEVEPENANALTNFGNALLDKRQFSKALAYSLKALEVEPNLAVAWYNKGVAEDFLGQKDEAVLSYQKALEKNPMLFNAYFNLALVYFDRQDWTQSIALYEKLLELSPFDKDAYYNLGLCYVQLNDAKQAIVCFTEATRLGSKQGETALSMIERAKKQ